MPKRDWPDGPETRAWIDTRWKWLIEQFGIHRVRSAAVLLPSEEFFPDKYDASLPGARLLLQRLCGYLGVTPEAVQLELFLDTNPVHNERGRQGATGYFCEGNQVYHIGIDARQLHDPLTVVATLAHELCHVHLLGGRLVSTEEPDHEFLTDLLAVYLGAGVFMANAALREETKRMGDHATWSLSSHGYLTIDGFGYALARFAHERREMRPLWAKQLRPDARNSLRNSLEAIERNLPPTRPWGNDTSAELETWERNPREELTADADPPAEQGDNEVPWEDGSDESAPDSLTAEELWSRFQAGERDFGGVRLRSANLASLVLTGINLANADLCESDFSGAILDGANLSRADMEDCRLVNASLRGARLSGTSLWGADLTAADLTGADLRGTTLAAATLKRAIFLKNQVDLDTDFVGAHARDVITDLEIDTEIAPRWGLMKWGRRMAAVFMTTLGGFLVGAFLAAITGNDAAALFCTLGALFLGLYQCYRRVGSSGGP